MFRLVTLLDTDGLTVAVADTDGYTCEPAAWAAYCAGPGRFSGVARYDTEGRLVELIIDRVLYPDESPDPWDRLARDLGVHVRTVPMALRRDDLVDIRAVRLLIADIERDLPLRLGDPMWRRALCRDLFTEPLGMAGVVNAVRWLPRAAVLDLYPYLQDLAAELPDSVRTELRRHLGDPATRAGVTALRLGLRPTPQP